MRQLFAASIALALGLGLSSAHADQKLRIITWADYVPADVIAALKKSAINNENLFTALMEAVKYCSLGQITHALYEVGGQYRRNM